MELTNEQWTERGTFQKILYELVKDLYKRGKIDIREAVHRRELCTGKKRGLAVGKAKRGKGTRIMAIADTSGFPVAVCVESASPHEVKLVEKNDGRLNGFLSGCKTSGDCL